VINQQINLYQERFRKKQLPLSAQQSLIAVVGLIVLLLVSSYFYADMQHQQKIRHEQNLVKKDQLSQQLDKLKNELQKLLADNQLDQQITQVTKDIKVRKRMIDFVENNQFGSGEGFSENLGALAELPANNLWLSQISLTGDYIKLSGSALQAQNVPEYFNQFQSRGLFEGKVFDVFELGRNQQFDWKVDFVIASRAVANE
jgi:hypothetical protein